MKKCSKCKESKDESGFHKDKRAKSGLASWCIECHQRYNQFNKSGRTNWSREYLKHQKALRLKWAAEHPNQVKLYKLRSDHKRRVKLINSPFPKEFRLGPCCWVCLSTENLTVDHIIPVSRGGTNDISNLTTLCGSCNSRKNNKLYSEWLETPDFLKGEFK